MYSEDELRKLDLITLTDLYSQHVKILNTQLLAGSDWAETNETRRYLTQIGVVIDIKIDEKNPTLNSK